MGFFTSKFPHPYGVLPTGNALLLKDPYVVRKRGLGLLRVMSDEAVLELLSFLNGNELAAVLKVSRALYVYANYSDLWRDLTLRNFDGFVDYTCSWKDTFSKMMVSKVNTEGDDLKFEPHKPIKVANMFCNVLHRSWTCHTCDLENACPGFFDACGVVRRDANDMSTEVFVDEYETKNIPVIIRNAAEHWPSMKCWNPNYLAAKCKDKKFRATSATAPLAATFTMEEYFKYSAQTKEEAALYLFDRDFTTIGGLGDDYDVPNYFNSTKAQHGTDLFHVFGEKQRPDYRWLIAGPARSGSIFHVDPNQTNAWNVCVKGRKKWIFYPPNQCPPGVVSSIDGADVTVPLSTGEWLLSFWDAHLEAKKNLDPKLRPFEAIVEEGEMIFVPHGFWHMVVNLDDCIAITQNYVSTSNLGDCLKFLREKPDQISGVRDRIGEAIQPEEIYDLFIKKLEEVLPKETLDKAINDSFATKKSVMKRGKSELSGFFNGYNQPNSIAAKKKQKTSISSDEKIQIKSADEFSFQFSFDQ